ncbi:MAG TPA: hypothetical protein VGZ33_04545 [Acidimicrobiales bacterium]|nr:hypothetical protein [Acidimicrobiales bacterium]
MARSTPHASRTTEPGPLSIRGWLVLAGGVLSGVVILVAWLPLGALLSQRSQLSSASSRLEQLSSEGSALAAESAALRSPTALDQLAREQYQLVAPGQRLIQVLTPSFTPTSKSKEGPYPGDPGLSPIVDPTGTAPVAPSPSGATTSTSTSTATSTARPTSGQGFVSRVVATLEFWH